jgi:uncharacterized protein YndB with AHSA1/START domain
MSESIVDEIQFAQPPERVWRALTDSGALERWLMPNDFEPRLGHRFTFRTDPVPPYFDGIVHCEVTELEPPRRLAYTWSGGPLAQTQVRYELEPAGSGTRLRFEHSGFDLADPGQRAAYEAMKTGWTGKNWDRLQHVVEELAAVR